MAGSLGAAACLTAIALVQTTGDGTPQPTDLVGVAATVDAGLDLDAAAAASGRAPTTTASPRTTLSVAAAETISLPMPASAATVAEEHLVSITVGVDTAATGIVVDGYLITSASAVGNQLSVTYTSGESGQLAYLVGVDPFSDLAVFRPSGESRAGRALEALTTTLAEEPPETTTPDETEPNETDRGAEVILASMSDHGIDAEHGYVIETGSEGITPDGQPLIGLIDTSIRRPAYLGGLLLTPEGTMLGLAVDTSSALASVIPIADALTIADRLNHRGWANETWIGFVGIDQDDGVEVVDVDENGPAARADLRPGDVIRFFDGAPIEHMGGITAGLRRAAPGDSLVVVVERSGELVVIRVKTSSYEREPVSESAGG